MKSDALKKIGEQVRKDNKRDLIKRYLLTSLVMLLIYFAYNLLIGNYIFLGKETSYTEATVCNTKKRHLGKAYYKQFVRYRFTVDRDTFYGNFITGKILSINEKIWVEYAIDDPKINEPK